jgi:lysozyme family protein
MTMDRNFARSLSLVLKSEGGWSDNPADPGGATMKGVTLANFRRFVKSDATKADLKKITDEQVATVYRRFYWDVVAGAELPGGIDFAVFDFAVNSGPARAAKFLQAIVGEKQDGKIGPATLAAVRKTMRATVINDLCDKRMAFLKGLPTWKTFGKGWTDRVSSVRAEALKMAAQPDKEPPVIKEVEKKVPVEVPVPVKAKDLDKPWYKDLLGQKEVATTIAIPGISALGGVPWQNVAIIAGLCIIAGGAYYLIRRRDAAKQQAEVAAIHADAAEAKAAI